MDWAICHDNGRNACRHSVQNPVKSVLFRSLLGRMGWRSKSVSTLTILLLAATVTVLNGLDTPVGVAVDRSGNVFVADSGIRLICKGLFGGPDRDRTDDLFHAMIWVEG
jgi:hypothetical protein